MGTTKILGVIPARFKSSRYPGKPLVDILGKPMILWVAELSSKALGKENVVVATEDDRIMKVAMDAGFRAIMTSDSHLTGTDRIAEVAMKIGADIYINIQGDEPTVNPDIISKIVKEKMENDNYVINAMAKLSADEYPQNVNIPKVITNINNDMVYMSRVAIPGYKDIQNRPDNYYKQVCIYAFNRKQLEKYRNYGHKGNLEESEDIEILRFLDLGVPVKMIEVESESYAVDVEGDLINVQKRLGEIHSL